MQVIESMRRKASRLYQTKLDRIKELGGKVQDFAGETSDQSTAPRVLQKRELNGKTYYEVEHNGQKHWVEQTQGGQ